MGDVVKIPVRQKYATFTITVGMTPAAFKEIDGWNIHYLTENVEGKFTRSFSRELSDAVQNFIKVFYNETTKRGK